MPVNRSEISFEERIKSKQLDNMLEDLAEVACKRPGRLRHHDKMMEEKNSETGEMESNELRCFTSGWVSCNASRWIDVAYPGTLVEQTTRLKEALVQRFQEVATKFNEYTYQLHVDTESEPGKTLLAITYYVGQEQDSAEPMKPLLNSLMMPGRY